MGYENFDAQGVFPGIPYFSDPNMIVGGVPIGDVNNGNNALTLRRTKHLTALYSDAINIALSDLSVSSSSLSPAFNANTTSYTVSVPNSVTSITLTGTANHACATVSGDGAKTLNTGNNTYMITARLGGKSKNYMVIVNRALPTDPNLIPDQMVIAGKVNISGPMRSDGAVNIFAANSADTGKVEIDNISASAMLMTDTIIFYSNDTSDGLLRNLNDKGGGVKGITTPDQPQRVIVRKNVANQSYTYITLPFQVAANQIYKASNGSRLTGGDEGGGIYYALEFNAKVRSDESTIETKKTFTEIDYTKGFAKATGYAVWHDTGVTSGEIDFVTTTPAEIKNLFSVANKTKTFPIYAADASIGWDYPEYGDGWAFIGGLNSTTFGLSADNIRDYGGTSVWYRNERTSQSTGKNQYLVKVLSTGEVLNIGPYTPFYIQDVNNVSGTVKDGKFTYTKTGLSLQSAQYRSASENTAKDQLYFVLSSDKDQAFDRFYLVFADNFSEDYKASEDAITLSTSFEDAPAVWALLDETNKELALNGLPMKDEREVRIGFSVPEAGDYLLNLTALKQTDVRNVILVDNVTGEKMDLLHTPYSFSTAGPVERENNRFAVYINSSITDITAIKAGKPYAYTKNNLLTVKNLSEGDKVSVLDVTGRIIAMGKVGQNKEFETALPGKGTYVVLAKGAQNTVIKVIDK